MEFKAKIIDPIGIHARPASILVSTASAFRSKIILLADGKTADVKSIMNLMALGVKNGTEITVTADGDDAAEAIAAVEGAMKKANLI